MEGINRATKISAPIVTIIVPITRMQGRLTKLENWLCKTNFNRIEVILVHDVQDNLTSQELKLVQGKYPEIILIEQTLNSAGLARNAGLKLALGEWIIFWDSDDCPDISVLEEFIVRPSKNEFDVYVFNFEIENNAQILSVKTDNWKELAFMPGIWRIIFSKVTAQKSSFPNFPLGEDQFYLANLNFADLKVCYVNKNIYRYIRGVEGQATSIKSNIGRLRESLDALNLLRKSHRGNSLEFTNIVYWRQILTIIKRGDMRLRFGTLFRILLELFKFNNRTLSSFKSFRFVILKAVGLNV